MHVRLYCITFNFILFRTLDPHTVPVYKTNVLSTSMGIGHEWICRPIYAQNIHKTRMFNVAMFTRNVYRMMGGHQTAPTVQPGTSYMWVSDSVEICRRSTNSEGNTSADGRADKIVFFFSRSREVRLRREKCQTHCWALPFGQLLRWPKGTVSTNPLALSHIYSQW
jgi:hypothetical protein